MKLLRDPLVHFLLIGAVLFGVFHVASADDESAVNDLVVSAGQVASLQAVFSRTWQRPPSAEELDSLIAEHIRDEVLAREAVAMGLDRDDAVIRRRLRQKMEFVADLAADAEPSDADLKVFVAEHPDWFRTEPRFSFSHVYFKAGVDGPGAAELERLRQAFDAGTTVASVSGDPFIAGFDFQSLSRSDVVDVFGETFAAGIDSVTVGGWAGPVASAYGAHLVRLSERADARQPPFEDIRAAARREWLHARKAAADAALYAKLRARYVVTVEAAPAQPAANGKLAEATP